MPAVTVAIATFGRGAYILPTLRSVQLQEFSDFEALVVGDGDASSAAAVAALGDRRFRFVLLEQRVGAQSGPNNRARDEARAPLIAYLGHDDVWLPGHLAAIMEAFSDDVAIAVSGLANYFAAGAAPRVRGLFAGVRRTFDDDVFVPPSAFAHRLDGFPRWRSREEVGTGTDVDLFSRAMEAGAAARSTGRITALKWAAMTRYLSYLAPSCDEQAEAVAAIEAGRTEQLAADALAAAAAAGTLMPPVMAPVADKAAWVRRSDEVRGLVLPAPVTVDGPVEAAQTAEARGRDWRVLAGGLRWSGDEARPRLYLPFVGAGRARISLHVRVRRKRPLDAVRLTLEGAPILFAVAEARRFGHHYLDATLSFAAELRRDRGLVLGFTLPPVADAPELPMQMNGIAVGLMQAVPE